MGARQVKFPPMDYGPCFGHSFAARTSGILFAQVRGDRHAALLSCDGYPL